VTCHYAMVVTYCTTRKVYYPDGALCHHLCQRLQPMAELFAMYY